MRSKTKSRQGEYVSRLNELYSAIEKWTEDTGLQVSRGQTELHEEVSGRYEAPTLVIQDAQGKKVADLLPVGAWIIGAEGRVDLVGLLDRNSLLYMTPSEPQTAVREKGGRGPAAQRSSPLFKGVEEAGWYWIGDTRLGRARPLTKELFLDLLSEVSDYGAR